MRRFFDEEVLLRNISQIKDLRTLSLKTVGKVINNIPAADVEEVKRGQWEYEYPGSDNLVCPNCGKLWNTIDNCTEEFERCPKCGCVIVGTKENEHE